MEYYLVLSTIMMFVGIYGFVTRRNLLAMLISVELILNSVDINFVVFNRFLFPEQLEGFFFYAVRHRDQRRGDGRRHRHHHQYLPQHPQYRGQEPAGDEVVAENEKRLLWNIRF